VLLNQVEKVQLLIFYALEDILKIKKNTIIVMMDFHHLELKVQRFLLVIKRTKNFGLKKGNLLQL